MPKATSFLPTARLRGAGRAMAATAFAVDSPEAAFRPFCHGAPRSLVRNNPVAVAAGGLPVIKSEFDLDFQWPVQEPFLFCVHHHDKYPDGKIEKPKTSD
jgi:hypothetical protein